MTFDEKIAMCYNGNMTKWTFSKLCSLEPKEFKKISPVSSNLTFWSKFLQFWMKKFVECWLAMFHLSLHSPTEFSIRQHTHAH